MKLKTHYHTKRYKARFFNRQVSHFGNVNAMCVGMNSASCTQASRTFAAGTCYELRWWTRLTWYAARQDCISRGGDLLRLDNEQMIMALMSGPSLDTTRWWIDGVRELWMWTTGTYIAVDIESRDCDVQPVPGVS